MKLILAPLEKGGEISSLYKIGAAADVIVFHRAPSIFSASLLSSCMQLSAKNFAPSQRRAGKESKGGIKRIINISIYKNTRQRFTFVASTPFR